MNKSPCFPFYPSDFFGDVKVRIMSPDAQAFYALLLLNIWEYDTQYSIPDDENLISNLLGIDVHRLGILLAEMRPCFLTVRGRLISKRLKREKTKQDNYRKQQSEKGKLSAQQRLNRGSTVVQPEGQPKPNSSIPKPIPIYKRKKVKKENHPLTDEEWLDSLKKNPAYKDIDVEILYQKMVVWCGENNKKPTRKRFVNWLNREDKPMRIGGISYGTGQQRFVRGDFGRSSGRSEPDLPDEAREQAERANRLAAEREAAKKKAADSNKPKPS